MEALFTLNFLMLAGFGFMGMFVHWLKKWARDQTTATYFEWLTEEKKYTLATIMAFIGFLIPAVLAMSDPTSTEAFALVFTTGYSIDSMLNRSA